VIHHLEGKLVKSSPGRVVLETGGVGLLIHTPLGSCEKLGRTGENCRLLTYLHVREDELTLYGFVSEEERELFKMLLGVSKVGPKLALSVLSSIHPAIFKKAVVNEDATVLSAIRGVGRKTAERMIVELKDRIATIPRLQEAATEARLGEIEPRLADALGALLSLGFTQLQAQRALQEVLKRASPDWPVERLVKEALKQ